MSEVDYREQWAEGEIEAGTLLDAIDELRAELAALKGGQGAATNRKTWSPAATGFSCLHCGTARAYHDMQTFCPTGPAFASGSSSAKPVAPPAQASAWVAEGWKLVPVEPTPEMIKAMRKKHWEIRGCQLCEQDYRDIHVAMLATAPTPGASDGKGGE